MKSIIKNIVFEEINRFLCEETLPNVISYQHYYDGDGDLEKRLAHGVKRGDEDAIEEASRLLSTLIQNPGSIFIPIPNHQGYATYTLKMAEKIAKYTNGRCCDILDGNVRDTLYSLKKNNDVMKDNPLGFRLKNLVIVDKDFVTKPIFLVDNVLDTGKTYREAKQVIERMFGNEAHIYLLVLANTDRSVSTHNIIQGNIFNI